MRPVRAAARTMLSAIFIASGASALANPKPFAPPAKRFTERVAPLLEKADSRLPTDAERLVQINAATQVAAGLMLATGHLTRPAATVLAGTLVPTTLAGHPFWLESDEGQRRTQQIQFLKNLGLFGGLMLAALDTEGRPGLRWRAGHLMNHTQKSWRRSVRTAQRETKLAMAATGLGRRLAR